MVPFTSRIQWPDGKKFAFTAFDDPDFQTVELGKSQKNLKTEIRRRPRTKPKGERPSGSNHVAKKLR